MEERVVPGKGDVVKANALLGTLIISTIILLKLHFSVRMIPRFIAIQDKFINISSILSLLCPN
jgi:hypothetical protein